MIPNKVLISGHEWRIIQKKGVNGGWFDGEKKVICLDKEKDKSDKFEILLHEILEAILNERAHRYSAWHFYRDDYSKDMCYQFSFNHSEFTNIVKDLRLALKSFLK